MHSETTATNAAKHGALSRRGRVPAPPAQPPPR